ncbi:MAG TPA: hypothetical protein VE422_32885 [Terriglobia bacterium]|nr:hypothetical protein [Terriglobia bacterium]
MTRIAGTMLLLLTVAANADCQSSPVELGVQVTGAHLHKIDITPVGIGARLFLNFTDRASLDAEVTHYFGETSAMAGLKSGFRWNRFGAFGKARTGVWHIARNHFAIDFGGIFEFYPSRRTAIRIDAGDAILFYGTGPLGTVHNFQPGLGVSYRF